MQTQIQAHFNKQTKDSKKELVQFYVNGADEKKPELNSLCREVVELSIDGVEATLIAEFVKKTQDAKKTAIEFVVKGDTSAAVSYEFYRMAGADVTLTISESQMSIDEFRGEDDEDRGEYREGVRGTINPDGTVDVDKNQLTFDEVAAGAEQEGMKITDISEMRRFKQDAAKAEDDPMAGVLDEDEDLLPV
jgi:hypothetical protein